MRRDWSRGVVVGFGKVLNSSVFMANINMTFIKKLKSKILTCTNTNSNSKGLLCCFRTATQRSHGNSRDNVVLSGQRSFYEMVTSLHGCPNPSQHLCTVMGLHTAVL